MINVQSNYLITDLQSFHTWCFLWYSSLLYWPFCWKWSLCLYLHLSMLRSSLQYVSYRYHNSHRLCLCRYGSKTAVRHIKSWELSLQLFSLPLPHLYMPVHENTPHLSSSSVRFKDSGIMLCIVSWGGHLHTRFCRAVELRNIIIMLSGFKGWTWSSGNAAMNLLFLFPLFILVTLAASQQIWDIVRRPPSWGWTIIADMTLQLVANDLG